MVLTYARDVVQRIHRLGMSQRNYKTTYYPESRFGGFTDVDGTIAFYLRVNALTDRSSVVLDFGCGRGAYGEDEVPVRRHLRALRGRVEKVIGLDVDEHAGQETPFVDEFHRINGDRWPLADNAIDVCVCDSVIEHLN